MQEKRSFAIWEFLAFDQFMLLSKAAIYFVSLAGPVWFLFSIKNAHPLIMLACALISFPITAFTFVLTLAFLKKAFFRFPIRGRFFRRSPKALRWLMAALFNGFIVFGPFMRFINNNMILRHFYYWAMGAKIGGAFIVADNALLLEPWGLTIGADVLIGGDAMISCHKIERNVVTLSPVEIGTGALIGARAMIHPGASIGANAIVGAGAIVTEGTIIPAGETWAGHPAKKVDPLAEAIQRAREGKVRAKKRVVAAIPI